MSSATDLVLLGVGGAGIYMAHGIRKAFGEDMRVYAFDTDGSSDSSDTPFLLLGGNRLSGRGTGGDVVAGRMATEDSIELIDQATDGARIVIVVTALGGGTGSGATFEIAKRLKNNGIATLVIATMPFIMEGDERRSRARGSVAMIQDTASSSIFVDLDRIAGDTDNMKEAMERQLIDMLASAVALFWRVLAKPGYIHLDIERLRKIILKAGRSCFAATTARGASRAMQATQAIIHSPLLADNVEKPGAILCGILAGDDLRLSEVAEISAGIRETFGSNCTFELATVNDEENFAGSISVVVVLLEAAEARSEQQGEHKAGKGMRGSASAKNGALPHSRNRGRFNEIEPTVYDGEDLDVPTYLRKSIDIEN